MPAKNPTIGTRRQNAKIILHSGERFGRLTIIEEVAGSSPRKYLCLCDCGTRRAILRQSLSEGITRSCGCLISEVTTRRFTRHGRCGTRIYLAWNNMRRRCTDPRNDRYAQYGGRGIKVCERWQKFENFLADMGEPPAGTSLDRKDNDGNYEPGNCRWATKEVQSNNKQQSRAVTIDGATRSISEWIEILKLNRTTVYRRMRRGMDAQTALLAADGRR